MTTTFLYGAAKSVFTQNTLQSLKEVCVVLPSRRAVFFFKNELSKLSEVPFISPSVFSIDDFVCQLSGLQISDQVSLFFDLYAHYQQYDKNISFEEFITWAPTVLKDFDLIDQYLVDDVKALFNYMSETEALKRWELDSEKPLSTTENTRNYFQLYDNLSKVYFDFRRGLFQKNKAYRGMAYRVLAEDVDLLEQSDFNSKHFYFLGLNALSKSEEKIITTLVKSKKATCIWDTDTYFMNQKHQAGEVLKKYQNSGIFGKWNDPENYLLTSEKDVTIYESPFNSIQAKVGTLLSDEGNTVFVVPDENLIQPLLFSLNDNIEEYNITMGLGLGQSKLASLISILFDLHSIGSVANYTSVRYSHTFVQKVFTDPLIRKYETLTYDQELPYTGISKSIIDKNKVFITERELTNWEKPDELLKVLFTSWKDSPTNALESLRKLLILLSGKIFNELDSMEKEFFMLLNSVLNRLQDEVNRHKSLNMNALRLLLKELSKIERVPFTGEPIAPLQIMSLLETRCLDFEHVVLYSFNEGVIPSSEKNNSLIPYEACREYGIPVFSDQDSIMAYHFYRLLMRAKKVDIIFTNAKSTGIGGSKDASRFILQLINDLAVQNSNIKIKQQLLDFKSIEVQEKGSSPISIKKNGQILGKIKHYLEQNGLSASSISQYYNCSLQFYFSKILDLKESSEVEETFASDVFGNWIHKSIEIISKEIIRLEKETEASLLPKVLAAIPWILDRVFQEHFHGYQVDRGINLIYRKMAERLLKEYYEKCFFQGESKIILSVEEKFSKTLKIEEQQVLLKINGLIDSIELWGKELALIDYKTGKVQHLDINISSKSGFSETFENPSKSKFRQLLIYKYLIEDQLENDGIINKTAIPKGTHIRSGMYSFRDLSVFHEQNNLEKEELKGNLESSLSKLVSDIMNNDINFQETEDRKICEYCAFKTICMH